MISLLVKTFSIYVPTKKYVYKKSVRPHNIIKFSYVLAPRCYISTSTCFGLNSFDNKIYCYRYNRKDTTTWKYILLHMNRCIISFKSNVKSMYNNIFEIYNQTSPCKYTEMCSIYKNDILLSNGTLQFYISVFWNFIGGQSDSHWNHLSDVLYHELFHG